jgi:hypothetical protein
VKGGEFHPAVGRAVARRRHVEGQMQTAPIESPTSDLSVEVSARRLPECFRLAAALIRQESLGSQHPANATTHCKASSDRSAT